MAALLQLEPTTGVEKLERILAKIPVSKDSAALDWFGELFDTHHLNAPVNLSQPGFTPELLLHWSGWLTYISAGKMILGTKEAGHPIVVITHKVVGT
ncbi:hypothetical protein CWS02_05375 [Enterobacter sp. EA-1]|nr:hypothetical protein CWS02_05375 [Enterobacter sp. EA-1]